MGDSESPAPVHAEILLGLISCRSCSLEYLPQFTLGCWLAWSCAGFVEAITSAVSSWMQGLCHVQKRVSPQSSCLSQSLRPFPTMVPETWERSSYRHHICDEALCRHLSSSVSLFWVSAFTTVYCTEKFPWWGARAALNYGYLGSSLSMCSFSKIIIISWPTDTVCYQTWDLGQIYSVWHMFLLAFRS